MNFPLSLSFKILAIARQLSVTDATGGLVFYVKQKAFKLKESITVYADREQTQPFYKIEADRVIDFRARFHFTDMSGRQIGAVKREGMKSLWRASYTIFDGEQPVMQVREENPWTKMLDGVVGEIPVLGIFSGYLLHPSYIVTRTSGEPVMRLKKQPAFFEGKFTMDKLAMLDAADEVRVVLALLTMVLLERGRG